MFLFQWISLSKSFLENLEQLLGTTIAFVLAISLIGAVVASLLLILSKQQVASTSNQWEVFLKILSDVPMIKILNYSKTTIIEPNKLDVLL